MGVRCCCAAAETAHGRSSCSGVGIPSGAELLGVPHDLHHDVLHEEHGQPHAGEDDARLQAVELESAGLVLVGEDEHQAQAHDQGHDRHGAASTRQLVGQRVVAVQGAEPVAQRHDRDDTTGDGEAAGHGAVDVAVVDRREDDRHDADQHRDHDHVGEAAESPHVLVGVADERVRDGLQPPDGGGGWGGCGDGHDDSLPCKDPCGSPTPH